MWFRTQWQCLDVRTLRRSAWACLVLACLSACGARPSHATLVARAVDACAGLPADVRESDPFAGADIASVNELWSRPLVGRLGTRQVLGASLVVRAQPGLTAEWLTRVTSCQLARNAALEVGGCNAAPTRVRVRSVASTFAVEVDAGDRGGGPVLFTCAQTWAHLTNR